MMIDYKGGKCIFCVYSKYIGALDFHHIDPAKKNFKLSMEELYRSWKVIIEEVDKCVLICANCHREIHGGVQTFSRTASEKHLPLDAQL